jgi:hypothetical protein
MRARVAIATLGPDDARLDALYDLPKLETWRREHVPPGTPEFDHRREMYDHLQRTVIGGDPIDFLEFGVFRGESLRSWCALNSHPGSRFVGFDSFEGLPEDWQRFDAQMTASTFDVDGELPVIGTSGSSSSGAGSRTRWVASSRRTSRGRGSSCTSTRTPTPRRSTR